MGKPPAESQQSAERWSDRIAQRYRLRLSSSWNDWFDSEQWQCAGCNEFNHPVSPETLLASQPDFIWPGFMPPDTLPVLGNKYGDWLCLRVGADDGAAEVLHWYHGGGDWIPWGANLAEAIAFDVVRRVLPGRRIAHAVRPVDDAGADSSGDCPHVRWAQSHVADGFRAFLARPRHELEKNAGADHFSSIAANPAVAASLILAALDSEFRRRVQPDTSRRLGIAWEPTIVMWMFDTDRVSEEAIRAVRRRDDSGDADVLKQDWPQATRLADSVLARRHDLGWAWDIRGWSAERDGELSLAVQCYRGGLRASAFADQSVRFRTHWFPESYGKFTAFRLYELQRSGKVHVEPDEYLQILWDSDAKSLRRNVTEYWTRVAEARSAAGEHARAYEALYAAGWDLGLQNLTGYRDLLSRLADTAEAAGQHGRAEVARTHLRCLTGAGES